MLLALSSSASQAAATAVTNPPSAWRLEDYAGGGVVLWFTSSPCRNGLISLGPNASTGTQARFWATVSAAKLTGKKIFVYYDNETPNCNLISFGFDTQ